MRDAGMYANACARPASRHNATRRATLALRAPQNVARTPEQAFETGVLAGIVARARREAAEHI